MKSTFFFECRTLREVKQRYKDLAMKHHPDRGGDNKVMQDINLEYSLIVSNPFFNFTGQSEGEKEAYIKFPEVINKIIHLNLVVEVCGQWIWVSGNTFPHREYLKACGFYFAKKKQNWYWRPLEYSSKNRNPLPMNRIRALYGSDIVSNSAEPTLTSSEGGVR